MELVIGPCAIQIGMPLWAHECYGSDDCVIVAYGKNNTNRVLPSMSFITCYFISSNIFISMLLCALRRRCKSQCCMNSHSVDRHFTGSMVSAVIAVWGTKCSGRANGVYLTPGLCSNSKYIQSVSGTVVSDHRVLVCQLA